LGPKTSILQKKGPPNFGALSCPKHAHDTGLRGGGKSRPGGAKISLGGQLPPYLPRLCFILAHLFVKYPDQETTTVPFRFSSQAATCCYQSNHSKVEAIP